MRNIKVNRDFVVLQQYGYQGIFAMYLSDKIF